jgi:hypothetical protein
MRRFVRRMRKRFRFDEIDPPWVTWTPIVSQDATAGRGKPRPYNLKRGPIINTEGAEFGAQRSRRRFADSRFASLIRMDRQRRGRCGSRSALFRLRLESLLLPFFRALLVLFALFLHRESPSAVVLEGVRVAAGNPLRFVYERRTRLSRTIGMISRITAGN